MSACDRIYFAVEQVAISTPGDNDWVAVFGLQSFGLSMDIPLQEIFQLGKLSPRTQLEDLPDVNMTLEKHLDGTPLVYHLCSQTANTPTLAGRSASLADVAFSVFDPTQDCATGVPTFTVQAINGYYQNVSYNFDVEGVFTESVGIIANDLIVSNDTSILNTGEQARASAAVVNGLFTGDDDFSVNRRENMLFQLTTNALDVNGQYADPDCTILPFEIDGILNPADTLLDVGDYVNDESDIQSISVSASITRNRKNALGKFAPVCQQIQLPVEVTTEIRVLPRAGGIPSATEIGILNTGTDLCWSGPRNRREFSIRIATCEGTRIYTGSKNKLRSFSMSEGNAGGSDASFSYTYRTLNDFTVLHINDPHTSGATWWTNREDFLVET